MTNYEEFSLKKVAVCYLKVQRTAMATLGD